MPSRAKKQWDKDGAFNLLTLDVNEKQKILGTPDTVTKEYAGSALDGKQFSANDFPGFKRLATPNLVAFSMYNSFRVTTTLQGTKDIVAEFKMTIAVNKVNGTWQKTTADTDPVLPQLFP